MSAQSSGCRWLLSSCGLTRARETTELRAADLGQWERQGSGYLLFPVQCPACTNVLTIPMERATLGTEAYWGLGVTAPDSPLRSLSRAQYQGLAPERECEFTCHPRRCTSTLTPNSLECMA